MKISQIGIGVMVCLLFAIGLVIPISIPEPKDKDPPYDYVSGLITMKRDYQEPSGYWTGAEPMLYEFRINDSYSCNIERQYYDMYNVGDYVVDLLCWNLYPLKREYDAWDIVMPIVLGGVLFFAFGGYFYERKKDKKSRLITELPIGK